MADGAALAVSHSPPHLLRLPSRPTWFPCDQEADVPDVSVERLQGATGSELPAHGVLMRHRGDRLVGMTVLHASQRVGSRA